MELRDADGLTEAEFLAQYKPADYPRPSVMVDIVILAASGGTPTHILLIKRGRHPFLDDWALPGGFVNPDETLEQAAYRELKEETGVSNAVAALREIGSFSTPGRDPRGWTISSAWLAEVDKDQLQARAGDDAAQARLFAVEEALDLPLAFDHADIITRALNGLRSPDV